MTAVQELNHQQEQALQQLAQYQAEYSAELVSASLQHTQTICRLQQQQQSELEDLTAKCDAANTQLEEQQLEHGRRQEEAEEQYRQQLSELNAVHAEKVSAQEALSASQVSAKCLVFQQDFQDYLHGEV